MANVARKISAGRGVITVMFAIFEPGSSSLYNRLIDERDQLAPRIETFFLGECIAAISISLPLWCSAPFGLAYPPHLGLLQNCFS